MTYHIARVNSLIRQELSEMLRRDIKDPRLGTFVTVTAVATAPDMRHAKVYVSRIGSDEEKHETLRALGSAAGYLRREMAFRLKLRRMPELAFHWDDSIERGDRLLRMIEGVTSEDDPDGEPSGGPEDQPASRE